MENAVRSGTIFAFQNVAMVSPGCLLHYICNTAHGSWASAIPINARQARAAASRPRSATVYVVQAEAADPPRDRPVFGFIWNRNNSRGNVWDICQLEPTDIDG